MGSKSVNRAERRRQEKAKSKVHIMTRDDIMYDKGLRAGLMEGMKMEAGQSVRLMTTALAAVLHREYGFGTRRLHEVLSHVAGTLESFQNDSDRERRAREWIKKETHLDLDDYTGARIIELREEMQKEYDMGVIQKHERGNELGIGADNHGMPVSSGDRTVGNHLLGDEFGMAGGKEFRA